MGLYDKRIENINKNIKAIEADAKQQTEGIAGLPEDTQNRYERLQNRAARLEGARTANEKAKQDITAYLNAWGIKTKAQKAAEAAKKAASQPQQPDGGGVTKASGNTSQQDNAGGTANTGGGGTTNTSQQGNAEVDPTTTFKKATEGIINDKVTNFSKWKEGTEKGFSAYETFVKSAIKAKEDIAQRKERNARAMALANAFGTLMNVITAGAMAKKGGYIPIISDYNKEYDTDLRKAIEGRYQIQNENEDLLMSLAGERRKHEAELGLADYKHESDIGDIKHKTAAGIYKAEKDAEEKKADREWKSAEAKANREWKTSEAEKDRKYKSGENAKDRKNRIVAASIGASRNNVTDGEAAFINGVAGGVSRTTTTQVAGEEPRMTTSIAPITNRDAQTLSGIYRKLRRERLTDEQMDLAIQKFREAWIANSSSVTLNSKYNEIVNAVRAE